ncbi:MAG: hypothetical protein U9N56_09350 [Actinomycetota bacterium]|nr:hypothetical protein [Actinomycetota bacterium]
MTDRRLIAIVGAGAVFVATILVIVFVAIEPTPEFTSLAPGEQSGFVAYAVDQGDEPGAVRIVDLATTDAVEAELGRDGDIVGWDDQGNLIIAEFTPSAERLIRVDPTSGERVGSVEPQERDGAFEEEPVWVDHNEGNIILEREDGVGFASFPAPESYDVYEARTMGDDRIVFVDELGRVAVTYLGENVTPVMVGDDALGWWRIAARP